MFTLSDQKSKDKNPTHAIYVTRKRGNEIDYITVGVAWKHQKGDGFNISLNRMVAFPLDKNGEKPQPYETETN